MIHYTALCIGATGYIFSGKKRISSIFEPLFVSHSRERHESCSRIVHTRKEKEFHLNMTKENFFSPSRLSSTIGLGVCGCERAVGEWSDTWITCKALRRHAGRYTASDVIS
jgi:hypothetical protein